MEKRYSTYEAKARFSEILRRVREQGETITVTYYGEAVAEIRPVPPRPEETAIEARLRELERRGALVRSTAAEGGLRPVARRPGALRRFLADRDA